jgi:Uncharacterized conserved protein
MTENLLFAYGTLIKGLKNEMAEWLAGVTTEIGTGYFPGKLYMSKSGYPAAIYDSGSSQKVLGKIIRLADPSTIWPKLDEYEGIGSCYPKPYEYRRVRAIITDLIGQQHHCNVYLYNYPVNGLKEIRSGRFSTIL